jgi:hypothetical protein
MRNAVANLAKLLMFVAFFEPGFQSRTVRIDLDDTGHNGIVEFVACSNKLLVKLAEISNPNP